MERAIRVHSSSCNGRHTTRATTKKGVCASRYKTNRLGLHTLGGPHLLQYVAMASFVWMTLVVLFCLQPKTAVIISVITISFPSRSIYCVFVYIWNVHCTWGTWRQWWGCLAVNWCSLLLVDKPSTSIDARVPQKCSQLTCSAPCQPFQWHYGEENRQLCHWECWKQRNSTLLPQLEMLLDHEEQQTIAFKALDYAGKWYLAFVFQWVENKKLLFILNTNGNTTGVFCLCVKLGHFWNRRK